MGWKCYCGEKEFSYAHSHFSPTLTFWQRVLECDSSNISDLLARTAKIHSAHNPMTQKENKSSEEVLSEKLSEFFSAH